MGIKVTIIHLSMDEKGEPDVHIFNRRRVYLGSDNGNQVVLKGDDISAIHACLLADVENQRLQVADEGSTNGISLNGTMVDASEAVDIKADDRLLIGHCLIKAEYVESTDVDEDKDDSYTFQDARRRRRLNRKQREGAFYVESDDSDDSAEVAGVAQAQETESEGSSLDAITNYDPDQDAGFESPEEVLQELPEEENPNEADSSAEAAEATSEVKEDPLIVSGVVGEAHVVDLDFEALRLCAIEGVITHRGKPLAGVTVDGGELGKQVTGSDGAFRFEEVMEHTPYELVPSREKFIFEEASVKGVIQDNKEITFNARELFKITGTVRHNGTPLTGVEVDAGPLGTTVTDDNGVYEFLDVPEGTEYTIVPNMSGFAVTRTK